MSQLDPDLLRDGVAYADRWVAYQQERREVPGIVVTIRHGDDVLLARGYGYADLERQIPMTPQHIFRIASHSKTFTATAIMQLLERGRLRLDDPLATSIPWLGARGDLARVTIRQALSHSSGIIRDGLDADHWHLEHDFPDANTLRHMVVEQGGAVLPANERFKYSNIAYGLLGLVVEAAGGVPYNQYVMAHIVDRLGLADTGPEIDDHARARLARGYTAPNLGVPRRPIPDIDTHALSAATGFYATAEDLSRYMAAHFFGNEEILSDASKREMQQPYWRVEQSDGAYGLGFSMMKIGERQLSGHGGGFPGYITRTMFDPRDRLAVVALTNTAGGPAELLVRAIIQILDFALAQPPASHRDAHDRYTGRFASLWGVTDVAAFGDTLVALSPEGDEPVKNVTRLAVEDPDTLRMVATGGYGSPGESVRYTRDGEDRVTAVRFGGTTSYPPDLYRAHELARGW